ncbi:MAG: ABC transporter ATP-binding protein [Candidatus Latescibacterota bacterium]
MPQYWIKTSGLCRYYRRGDNEVRAVDRVDLALDRGEFVAVVGASGSGKSTLLNLLAGLDTPTGGYIEVGPQRLDRLSRRELAAYRAYKVGMIFQSFNLLPHYTALKNVELGLLFSGTPRHDRRPRAKAILEKLGMADRLDHRPVDLSGGEQQRVAIARALVKKPEILFADEPTGNLDQDNSNAITSLMKELNREGITVVMVTHDVEMARETAGRVVEMHYGRIGGDDPGGGGRPEGGEP